MKLYLPALLTFLMHAAFAQDAWQQVYTQAQQHYQKGQLSQSYALARRGLLQAEIEYGEQHPYVADNLRLLTLVCYSSGMLEEGLQYATREAAYWQKTDAAHMRYGEAQYHKGLFHLSAENYQAAVVSLQSAQQIFGRNTHALKKELHTLYHLGRAQQLLGNYQQADSIYQHGLQQFSSTDSLRHLSMMMRYQSAVIQTGSGREEEGIAALLAIKEEMENSQDTLQTLYVHSLCLLAQQEESRNRSVAAAALYQKAARLMESSALLMDSLQYAQVLDQLGMLFMPQKQAAGFIRQAYEIRMRHGSAAEGSYWLSVDHMAQVLLEKGAFEEAIRLYEDHLSAASLSEDPPAAYTAVLNNLALLYWKKGRYEQATSYYRQALQAAELKDTVHAEANRQKISLFYNMARNYQSLSHFDTAIYYYKKALDWSRQYAGDHSPEYLACISGMAAFYQDIGYFTEAEIFYREALQIQHSVSGDSSNAYANLLNNYALLLQTKGDFQQAEVLWKKVLVSKKRLLGDKHSQTLSVMSNLGLLYLDIASYKEARSLLEEALSGFQQLLGDHDPGLLTHLVNVARLEIAEASYTKAEPLLKRAVRISEEYYGNSHPEYAAALLELANFYLMLGNYPVAESLLTDSRQIIRQKYGSRHPDYATATQNMATLYEATGKDSLAEALFQEALSVDLQVLGKQHPDYAISLNNLASFYQHVGKKARALPLFEESLTISQHVYGKEHPAYAATLLNVALLYQDLGRFREAEPLIEEVLALRKKLLGEKHPDYAYALYGKAVLYHRIGRFAEAVPLFRQVVSSYLQQIRSYFPALSEKEKSAFYKRIEPVLNAYRDFAVDILVNQKYAADTVVSRQLLGELYDLQLTTKAMLLDASSKIRKNIFSSGNEALMQAYQAWIHEKETLAYAYTLSRKALQSRGISIRALERKANELEKQLSAGSVLFAQDMEKKNLSWQDVQQHLSEEEGALEIIRCYKEYGNDIFYIALLITPSSPFPELIVFANGQEMESKNYAYYKNGIAFRVKDRLSYQVYWSAIAQKLPEHLQSLYIAPDGIYHKINLNSLYDVEEDKFLLEKLNLRMLSSTRELVEEPYAVSAESRQQQAYLFGYPNYRYAINPEIAQDRAVAEEKPVQLLADATSELHPFRFGISRLQGTRQEVRYIDHMLQQHAWNTYRFTENIALEENIKQVRQPRLLHIATHGYFMSDLPVENDQRMFGIHLKSMAANPLLRSGLLLAGSEHTILASEADESIVTDKEAEDGILTAYEAMNLDLIGTDLVVLSACETGLGDVKNGEGVYGLQRAFLVAGAHSVMMSLWKVNDEATTELVKKFYQHWLSGEDKFTALRNAQIAIKDRYQDPYFWAPFVLIGR